jgi:hypothetical protein
VPEDLNLRSPTVKFEDIALWENGRKERESLLAIPAIHINQRTNDCMPDRTGG